MALDVIFLSYDEPNADKNWDHLKNRISYAKRVHGISGIFSAHLNASNISNTTLFYVIDGDSEILPNFDFTYKPPVNYQNYTHVWRSKNPVNGLTYGYGGIKILSKKFFRNVDSNVIDVTTSISDGLFIHDEIASMTHFNSSPFHAWRGAFRECVKLSSKSITGQIDNETEERLNIWCNVGENEINGKYVIDGARMGKKYGIRNKNSKNNITKINDFCWLERMFNDYINR